MGHMTEAERAVLSKCALCGEEAKGRSNGHLWVGRFKYRIKIAPARFELGFASCPAHVRRHRNQLWSSNSSPFSI